MFFKTKIKIKNYNKSMKFKISQIQFNKVILKTKINLFHK